MTTKNVLTPWCDAKHYDHPGYASSTYCTCSRAPGHSDAHKCWGCAREWPNAAPAIELESLSHTS